jgi:DNA adenine methylase
MQRVPHPVQYQGSKRQLASAILRYVPARTARLIEPFAGSAAMSIASAVQKKSAAYWVNDLNQPLAKLLQLMVETPEQIAADYAQIWQAQHGNDNHYYQVRQDFNRTHSPALFLYLLARCVKGAVRYNGQGEFNQSHDKRRCGTKPDTMRANILGVSALLKGRAQFSAQDYRVVLDEAQKSDVVYLDPPYQGVCGERDARYFSGIAHDDFVTALDELNQRDIAYIVSYDGRRGEKIFGEPLPDFLDLRHVELNAGRSSQATLLGRDETTIESLYFSRALAKRLPDQLGSIREIAQVHYA